MPKTKVFKESAEERFTRVFRACSRYYLERRGEHIEDLAKIAPGCRKTVYNRMNKPLRCTSEEMLFYAPKFFSDRQLCEAFGVQYHGSTPE